MTINSIDFKSGKQCSCVKKPLYCEPNSRECWVDLLLKKASDEDVLISWSFNKMTLDVEALSINKFVEGLVDKRHPWTPSVPLIRLSCFVFVYIRYQ